MSDDASNTKDEEMGDQIEHVLREALRVAPLKADALVRIRAATTLEWRQASGSDPSAATSRRALWGSLAAAVAVLALLVVWYILPPPISTNFGMIARSNVGDADVRFQLVRRRALQ